MSKNDTPLPSEADTAEREKDTKYEKTLAKYLSILSTLMYIVLFPFCCYIWPLLGFLFEHPRMATTLGYWVMSLTILIPLSMPVSIYFIWSRYRRGLHEQAIFFCALPVIMCVGIFFVVSLLL